MTNPHSPAYDRATGRGSCTACGISWREGEEVYPYCSGAPEHWLNTRITEVCEATKAPTGTARRRRYQSRKERDGDVVVCMKMRCRKAVWDDVKLRWFKDWSKRGVEGHFTSRWATEVAGWYDSFNTAIPEP